MKIINDNNADVLWIDSHYEFYSSSFWFLFSFFKGNKPERRDTLKNVLKKKKFGWWLMTLWDWMLQILEIPNLCDEEYVERLINIPMFTLIAGVIYI